MSEELPNEDFINYIDNDAPPNSEMASIVIVFCHLLYSWKTIMNVSDSCFECLLKIISYFIQLMKLITSAETLDMLLEIFPRTIYKIKRLLGLDRDDFIKYVCCPKCNHLYKYIDATSTDRNGVVRSTLCSYIRFENHTQAKMRQPCGEALMKEVITLNGKGKHFYPHKVYVFQPMKIALERIINRAAIQEDLMRPFEMFENFHDVYEGNLWKEMNDINGDKFFLDRRNLGGLLNVDWFQPFSNSEHSVGVIYMVVLNLSRRIRFLPENVIIVGIIPGPREPELVINTFLKPFVDDLLLLWHGVYLRENNTEKLYRFVLVGTSSDLPATRKCCGFLSFNALRGKRLICFIFYQELYYIN